MMSSQARGVFGNSWNPTHDNDHTGAGGGRHMNPQYAGYFYPQGEGSNSGLYNAQVLGSTYEPRAPGERIDSTRFTPGATIYCLACWQMP